MKKETYLRKLEVVNALVNETTTVVELREKNKIKNELKRFLLKATNAWLEENVLHMPVVEYKAHWHDIDYSYDVKLTGRVTVKLYACDQNWSQGFTRQLVGEYRIPKKELVN